MKLIEHNLWVRNAPYHKTNIMLRIQSRIDVIHIQHFKIWIRDSIYYYQGKVNEAS